MGVCRGLAAASYEAAAASLLCSGPDREQANYSVLLWWNWVLGQCKFHSFTVVDDSLSRAFARARLSDQLMVEREE